MTRQHGQIVVIRCRVRDMFVALLTMKWEKMAPFSTFKGSGTTSRMPPDGGEKE